MSLKLSNSSFIIHHSSFKFIIHHSSFIILLIAVFPAISAAPPAFAADDETDTVVLGLAGNELFDWYKDNGYTTISAANLIIDTFNADTTKTRLLVLKNAVSPDATPAEWTFPPISTPPGSLNLIEGGSLTKPYDVKINGVGTPLFNFTDAGESGDPFVIRGVAISGAQVAVTAGGNSFIELDGCYIHTNQTHGAVVSGGGNLKLTNCVFFSNEDGLRVEGGTAEAIHCTFYSNRGAGIQQLAGTVTATNCLVANNTQFGVKAAGSVNLNACNFYNNGADYDPASLDTASTFEIETLFDDTSPWRGRLLTTPTAIIQNVQIKKGAGGTGVTTDFQGDGRGSPPYIGADELNPNDAIGFWSKCVVYTEPVGKNGASVLINYSGTLSDLADSLFLVPQECTDPEGYIPVPLRGDDGVYWGEIGPIDTIRTINGTQYISDGLGKFVLDTPARLLDVGSEYIVGQAVAGHVDVLVDTIPPVPSLAWYQVNTLVNWGGAVTDFAALGVPYGTPDFPYPPIAGYAQVAAPAISGGAVFAPYDVFPDYTKGSFEPPKYIYNVGSVSNGYNLLYPNQPLAVTVTATFVDPDVYTAMNLPAGPERPTAGMNSFTAADLPANACFSDLWVSQGLPAAWRLTNPDQGILASAPVNFSATAAPAATLATWKLSVPVVIGEVAQIERLHLIGDFIAMDKAGNFGNVNTLDRTVIPPLQISWLSGYGLRVDFRTRMFGAWPEVAWSVNDSGLNINRANPANPRPIYCYRIYGGPFGQFNPDPTYEPLTGWSSWSDSDYLSASFFDTNVNGALAEQLTDRWLLIVVGASDEAGNVVPWDFTTLAQDPLDFRDGPITLLSGATSGRNWTRFYVPGAATQIDTILYANLFYDDSDPTTGCPNTSTPNRVDLGPAPIVSYPPQGYYLFAEFNARILLNDPQLWATLPVGLIITGQQNGAQIFGSPGYDYVDSQASEIVPFQLPYMCAYPPQLGNPGNIMTYTVSAATVVDFMGASRIDDVTPATFSFKVIPGSVDDYLRRAGGQQPVRQFEAR